MQDLSMINVQISNSQQLISIVEMEHVTSDQISQQNIGSEINKAIPLKVGTILLLVVTFLIYRFSYNGVQPICLTDNIHKLTLPINRAIQPYAWHYVIGINQVLTDLSSFIIIIYWTFKCQNVRFPTALAIAYASRTIYMKLLKFPFPQNLIWKNPGFLSIFVPYDHTRDFFYSGHTVNITMIMFQFWFCSSYPLAILSTFSFFFIISTLVIVRVHYSIDVIAAFIYCIFFFNLVKQNVIYADKFWSAPYSLYLFIYKIMFEKQKKQQAGTSIFEDEN